MEIMKIITIGAILFTCRALVHEFGMFVDDVIPDSHKGETDNE